MKTWSKANEQAFASAAIIFLLANTASINGGIIDILRGDSAVTEPQRVAFVGGAQVKEAEGGVERLAGVDRWEKLEAGAKLLPGDVVRTLDGSAILCMTESKSFVKITPNTIMRLAAIETGWDRGIVTGREERSGFVVRSCRGQAFAADVNGQWKALRVNDVLAPGTSLRTANGAVVDLFHNTSYHPLRVAGSTQLRLETALLARLIEQPALAAVKRNR